MRLSDRLSRFIAFLRAGYAAGAPTTGHVALLALLRRRVTDSEVVAISRKLVGQRRWPVDTADIGVEITRVTDDMPAPGDIARIRRRLATEQRPKA
ncbi:DUF3349 domain-containing protein [Mycobacterium conspicuum]|jgi:hypothetical protein|uniref:Uncharacterized protein n=1 Tax=Mycobacterium conspicuum TaxID=44010 RepID=A0A1X1TIZ5_9MYCO|nr:DUF3349 domain-containing protein [Mycobacterium conspicuum]ORV44565.1 hypothetical protein AWC00_07110 [Mycobacterium conspicuum]BBZ37985.1 hypothetical protein MCNS_10480 [Mycobacterium conspicuum]